ncbi:unnamed protein product, partial [Ectocarpus sp. 12 AP-2014]
METKWRMCPFPLASDQLNADDTALCDECTFSYIAGECLSGDCELYDQDGTNANNEVVSEIDLAFEELWPSGELGGMLGDTTRYVIGDDGKPVPAVWRRCTARWRRTACLTPSAST